NLSQKTPASGNSSPAGGAASEGQGNPVQRPNANQVFKQLKEGIAASDDLAFYEELLASNQAYRKLLGEERYQALMDEIARANRRINRAEAYERGGRG
nr:hypothetical protein [bacterium]